MPLLVAEPVVVLCESDGSRRDCGLQAVQTSIHSVDNQSFHWVVVRGSGGLSCQSRADQGRQNWEVGIADQTDGQMSKPTTNKQINKQCR